MILPIKFKQGLKENLPTLDVGEPALCTDTKEFFLGTENGNLLLNRNEPYTHFQNVPEKVWRISHNLGYYPQCSVVDSAGTVAFGEVRHIDENTTEIKFATNFSGKVYIK